MVAIRWEKVAPLAIPSQGWSAERGEAMPQQKRGLGKGLGALIPSAPSAPAVPGGYGAVPRETAGYAGHAGTPWPPTR